MSKIVTLKDSARRSLQQRKTDSEALAVAVNRALTEIEKIDRTIGALPEMTATAILPSVEALQRSKDQIAEASQGAKNALSDAVAEVQTERMTLKKQIDRLDGMIDDLNDENKSLKNLILDLGRQADRRDWYIWLAIIAAPPVTIGLTILAIKLAQLKGLLS